MGNTVSPVASRHGGKESCGLSLGPKLRSVLHNTFFKSVCFRHPSLLLTVSMKPAAVLLLGASDPTPQTGEAGLPHVHWLKLRKIAHVT